ncbi:Asymmetric leaves 2 protein [Thalictrum thalictroides]|uniref:Asymmetric leaves 2 protein n=1 Tax=Thalictrum thalictroides TaxID=46969 RepID=A0A7J6VIZ2_THATH|nr:Asymmetric leaves 2 protein [Thalictrum thalictroides]
MASSSTSPCAACKFLRRKCQPECVFAPYFPPDQPHKFSNVHKVFGASNVTKLLNELHPHQREDAVNSLAYEADMRLRDPVYGCVGVISLLQRQLRQLQMDLCCAKSELSNYHNVGLTGHGLIAAHPHMGISLLTGPDHHHQFLISLNHQQPLRSFDINGGAYDHTSLIAAMNVSTNIGPLAQFQQQSPTAGGDDDCHGPS